jgi:hypothetical protein
MTELTRREFTESVVTAALLPLLGAGMPSLSLGWWQTAPAAGPMPDLDGDIDALAEALAGVIRAQYGDRMGDTDLAAITRQIRNTLERAQQMRKVDLANGDEPDFVFSAMGDAAP